MYPSRASVHSESGALTILLVSDLQTAWIREGMFATTQLVNLLSIFTDCLRDDHYHP